MNILTIVRHSSILDYLRRLVPNELVNSGKHLPMGILANLIYGFPSRKLTIIGVTGTDGKTTTATMLYHILLNTGYKVALVSTVSARIGNLDIDTGFHVTSPDHLPLQKLLKKICDQGFTHVVLEATSHGLAQHRFWGVTFFGGVVTNITEDHLDYHKTWENYALAKAKLFSSTRFAILNAEDKSYTFLKPRIKGKIVTYGQNKGDWNLKNSSFTLSIMGDFNRLNALAAVAAASELGVPKDKAFTAISTFKGVVGRMEVLQDKPFRVIVDFAHTPDALKTALTALRSQKSKRLIAVFGCAGERDKNRRKMGMVAAKKADITVITAEDPRKEGVEAISDEIAGWAKRSGAMEVKKEQLLTEKHLKYPVFIRIPDRQEAIAFSISIAKKGDIVGIFGKGHERSMCFGTVENPWSDQEAVRKSLEHS
ncbi:MAG: Mur ligase family protein [Patescibacteria group bacterium]|jgi:UDP-N-acetylmuramoyl-L-alanyl-D-glutamate--2,6-diaminopimelate ligase